MRGHGGHGGGGYGYGGGWTDGRMSKGDMMDLIHSLMDNRDLITRDYNNTVDGIESYTYSYDPQVSSWLQGHVYQMLTLMESDSGGIRMWDDLFREMFSKRHLHHMVAVNTTEKTEDGRVRRGVHVVQSVSEAGEQA